MGTAVSDGETLVSGIAGRYASALFELSLEQPASAQSQLAESIGALEKLLTENDDMRRLTASPLIEADDKNNALAAVLARINAPQILVNFVGVVIGKGRGFALSAMCRQFLALQAEARNELRAEVISVAPLSASQLRSLESKLAQAFGKSVVVESKTDASLLGGLVVKIGSRMIDGSLRTKLNALQRTLTQNTINEAG